jgi:hypothetical protein
MKLEITTEQYNQIQVEIIKLEDELRDTRDTMTGWDFDWFNTQIFLLKSICKDGYIELG